MSSSKLLALNISSLVLFGIASLVIFYYLYFMLTDIFKKGSSNYLGWMAMMLDKMFIKTTPAKCFAYLLGSTIGAALFAFYITFRIGVLPNILIALAGAFFGWNLPRIYLNIQYRRRLDRFDNQLTDALTLMSNSLRSGLNLNQVIAVVVREMPSPISQEFGLVLSQHQLGLTIDEALEKMMNRVPTEDLSMVINSVLILREKGGDISETFEVIAHTIRERRKVEGKIKAITAQGRMQALLLFLMPFATAFVMYMLNPENIKLMVTTKMGWALIAIMFLMQAIGGLWLRKIVNIKV